MQLAVVAVDQTYWCLRVSVEVDPYNNPCTIPIALYIYTHNVPRLRPLLRIVLCPEPPDLHSNPEVNYGKLRVVPSNLSPYLLNPNP